MSLASRAVRLYLYTWTNPFRTERSAQAAAASSRGEARPPWLLRRRCSVTETVRDGRVVITVAPRAPRSGSHILYLHGGGYIRPILRAHWDLIADLVRRTGATVTVPLYRLAPAADAESEYPFLLRLVRSLQAEASGALFLAGDSAGGGLALGLAITARTAGDEPARGVVLFSPWVDVTMTNPDMRAMVPRDPLLGIEGAAWAGRQWAGARGVDDPTISPIRDDLHGLPPVHIYQGEQDILLPDVLRFAAKAQDAGQPCTLTVYPDAFHVFVGAPFLPESRDALARVAAVVAQQSGSSVAAAHEPR